MVEGRVSRVGRRRKEGSHDPGRQGDSGQWERRGGTPGRVRENSGSEVRVTTTTTRSVRRSDSDEGEDQGCPPPLAPTPPSSSLTAPTSPPSTSPSSSTPPRPLRPDRFRPEFPLVSVPPKLLDFVPTPAGAPETVSKDGKGLLGKDRGVYSFFFFSYYFPGATSLDGFSSKPDPTTRTPRQSLRRPDPRET